MWQGDITYLHVPCRPKPLYLIAFLDDCSRFVVGWCWPLCWQTDNGPVNVGGPVADD